MRFPPELSLEAAREQYYRANGFSPDAPEWFVPIRIGRWTVPFPNSDARRRAIPLHDTHHIATGYATDLPGESEISAFELGAGCGASWPAWFYDLGGFALGVFAWPERTLRAFLRGRHARSLYLHPELAKARTVGELQQALGLEEQPGMRALDGLALAGMIGALLVYFLTWPLFFAVLYANAALRSRTLPFPAPTPTGRVG